jgi:hypothetical protein
MTEVEFCEENGETIRVDLKSPYLAAALAWLWPGAGHLYQRRYAKGMLFMVCILSTFFFGLGIGHGRVVYATTKREGSKYRWEYLLQMNVGVPALPAIVQNFKTRNGGDPFFVMAERFPADYGIRQQQFKIINDTNRVPNFKKKTLKDGFMAPPAGEISEDFNDVLGQWNFELKYLFDMGTYYCVIAGLLNLIVVYDAFVGPAVHPPIAKNKDP